MIQGENSVVVVFNLEDLNETRQLSKQSEMNPQTVNLSFEHTTTGHINTMSLHCIPTSILTASAVLSGPSGGQCSPMAHQL